MKDLKVFKKLGQESVYRNLGWTRMLFEGGVAEKHGTMEGGGGLETL